MRVFDHEKMPVYRMAIRYVGWVSEVLTANRRLHPILRNQLIRASTSIVLNIAEGAGEHSRLDKARFCRMARRSATESAALLDVLDAMKVAQVSTLAQARADLAEIVAMLTGLAKTFERKGGRSGRQGVRSEEVGD